MKPTSDQSGPTALSGETLRNRLRRALHEKPSTKVFDPLNRQSGPKSDYDLDPGFLNGVPLNGPFRSAAVLFPIVNREDPTVLLTQRSAHLPSHAGQIAFPGGKVEDHDTGPLAAALRETQEEIGLTEHLIEPLGYLDNYLTGTNFNVVPLVAMITPDFELRLDEREVDRAFEVPFSFLMDPKNHQRHQRDVNGRTRTYYAMPYGDHYIWGATAGMIRNLHERLLHE